MLDVDEVNDYKQIVDLIRLERIEISQDEHDEIRVKGNLNNFVEEILSKLSQDEEIDVNLKTFFNEIDMTNNEIDLYRKIKYDNQGYFLLLCITNTKAITRHLELSMIIQLDVKIFFRGFNIQSKVKSFIGLYNLTFEDKGTTITNTKEVDILSKFHKENSKPTINFETKSNLSENLRRILYDCFKTRGNEDLFNKRHSICVCNYNDKKSISHFQCQNCPNYLNEKILRVKFIEPEHHCRIHLCGSCVKFLRKLNTIYDCFNCDSYYINFSDLQKKIKF